MAGIVTGVRLTAEERAVLERLRREWGERSWSEVLRILLRDAAQKATARREGGGRDEG